MNASALYDQLITKTDYYDKKSKLSPEEYKAQLKITSTLYVGSARITRQHLEHHDGRSDLRAVQQVRGNKDAEARTEQKEEDVLRLLLRGVATSDQILHERRCEDRGGLAEQHAVASV